jgi:hypothetical protein
LLNLSIRTLVSSLGSVSSKHTWFQSFSFTPEAGKVHKNVYETICRQSFVSKLRAKIAATIRPSGTVESVNVIEDARRSLTRLCIRRDVFQGKGSAAIQQFNGPRSWWPSLNVMKQNLVKIARHVVEVSAEAAMRRQGGYATLLAIN